VQVFWYSKPNPGRLCGVNQVVNIVSSSGLEGVYNTCREAPGLVGMAEPGGRGPVHLNRGGECQL
jgi:hypothetical protein